MGTPARNCEHVAHEASLDLCDSTNEGGLSPAYRHLRLLCPVLQRYCDDDGCPGGWWWWWWRDEIFDETIVLFGRIPTSQRVFSTITRITRESFPHCFLLLSKREREST